MAINYLGPIVLVEDDDDDSDLFEEVFRVINVPNVVKLFKTAKDALDFLINTPDQPFIIISDINLPGMNGLELRAKIQKNERLRRKSIPFVFLSTNADRITVQEAYDLTVQGFFKKPSNFQEIHQMLKMIIDYWSLCRHPNN